MDIVPFVHQGLGNSSYLVGLPGGRALLVDPDRNVDRYLRAAEDRGWRIAGVLETHLHADFVSGTHELGARGAVPESHLYLPAGSEARFPHHALVEGAPIAFDGVSVQAVASPGHTTEHLAYVVRPPQGAPWLFSGGSLLVGGAARTDLLSPEMTERLTRAQHHTVHHAFEDLPDETALYPTHGSGSLCAAGPGGERTSTLGAERATNPVLGHRDQEEFVRWFPETFPPAPDYFFRLRAVNQAGGTPTGSIASPPSLPPGDFRAALTVGHGDDAVVVDVRPIEDYSRAHLPGALSIAFEDSFAVWLGWLVDLHAPLLFVLGEVPLPRVIEEARLVGFEHFAGVLDGGVDAWERSGLPLAHTRLEGGPAAHHALAEGAVAVDVREEDEVRAGSVPGAIHIPLGELPHRTEEVPFDRPLVVYCASGQRASSAASILERAGRGPILNVLGGYNAWREAE